ncbi:hypothetical protein D3C75_1020850 [compost metagenome]
MRIGDSTGVIRSPDQEDSPAFINALTFNKPFQCIMSLLGSLKANCRRFPAGAEASPKCEPGRVVG